MCVTWPSVSMCTKYVFWSGPQIKLLSAWTVGRGKLRKWLKNKWKNDFPSRALSQRREKAMGWLHAYLFGWGQRTPDVAAHYKTLPIYPPLSFPTTTGCGSWARLRKWNNPNLHSQLIMTTGKQSKLGWHPFSMLNWSSHDTLQVTFKLSSYILL